MNDWNITNITKNIIEDEITSLIITQGDAVISVPISEGNRHYQMILDATSIHGVDIWDGDIPTSVQEDADEKLFNKQADDYRIAKVRLERYELSVGKPEETILVETGEFEYNSETDTLDPVMEQEISHPAIEPLPATVEDTVIDTSTGRPVVAEVPNPLIVKDEEERTAAQAVVDATPQAVKEHVDNE